MREHADPLDLTEAGELLSLVLASARASAFRFWCRCSDLSFVGHDGAGQPSHLQTEDLVDITEEAEVAMQVLDHAYRRLSVAYFDAVGPDDREREVN